MQIPLLRAVTDRRLLGAAVPWRQKQLDVLRLFGDDALRIIVCAAGRQGGKSTMAVVTALWGATCRDDLDELLPSGRTRYALIAAPTEAQSRELIRVAAGMIDASPALRSLATVTADEITFRLPSRARTAIRALPANPRSVRGMSASLVIADEVAHFQREDQLSNDVEMIQALEGSMSVFDAAGRSKLILISTPRGEHGRFYELFTAARDGQLESAAVVHAPAWELNPALDSDEWRESKRRLLGDDGFRQEHGAEFVAGGGAFFDLRHIPLEDAPACPEDGKNWTAGIDPAFHGDRFGVALVGESVAEKGVLLVGRVEAIDPGARLLSLERRRAREDRTLEKVWEIIEPYQPGIVSDQHQADAVRSYFGRKGASVSIVNLTGPIQTAAFTSTRTRLLDGSLRLWRHPQLIEELRRVRARDTEKIELPRFGGGHADAASALALAVFQKRGVTDMESGEPRVGRGDLSQNAMFAELDGRPRRRPLGRPDPDGAPTRTPAGWGAIPSIRHMDF